MSAGFGDDEFYGFAGDGGRGIDTLEGMEGTDSCVNGERDQGCELP
jgi:hypothetical protein